SGSMPCPRTADYLASTLYRTCDDDKDAAHEAAFIGDLAWQFLMTATRSDTTIRKRQLPTVMDERGRIFDAYRCDVMRDLLGNPFRPSPANPTFAKPSTVKLAEVIYERRAFHRMPELADVLVQGGCCTQDVLVHCQSATRHVRGWWVLDTLL